MADPRCHMLTVTVPPQFPPRRHVPSTDFKLSHPVCGGAVTRNRCIAEGSSYNGVLLEENVNSVSGWCNAPNAHWVMLSGPLLIGLAAAVIVRSLRVRQLRRWDLRKTLTAPPVSPYTWTIVIFAVVGALSLTLANVAAEACAPEQKVVNVICLWIGCALFAVLCFVSLANASKLYREGRA